MIPLPHVLELETRSTCNRVCVTCIRNSEPDRAAAEPWFKATDMPEEWVLKALKQGFDLGIRKVCLSHYNEPLQDARIPMFARVAKRVVGFHHVFLHTNADFMTEELALSLDGLLDTMTIALYMDQPQKNLRERWIRSLFNVTALSFTGGVHIPTHYSPSFDVKALAEQHLDHPCSEPQIRFVINHRGRMLLCCDDLTDHFGLGLFPEKSLQELWFDPLHQQIMSDLTARGGRRKHAYCASCPRP